MNCNCIADQEGRILEGFKTGKLKAPGKAGAPKRVTFEPVTLLLDAGTIGISLPFKAHFDGLRKPYPVRMIAPYCPFCGKATAPPGFP